MSPVPLITSVLIQRSRDLVTDDLLNLRGYSGEANLLYSTLNWGSNRPIDQNTH